MGYYSLFAYEVILVVTAKLSGSNNSGSKLVVGATEHMSASRSVVLMSRAT